MHPLDLKSKAALFLLGMLVVLTVVEMVFSYVENRKYYTKRDTFNNLYLTAVAFVLNLSVKGFTFMLLNRVYQYRLFEIKNVYLYWFTLVVLQDFLYWVLHYTGHYCRVFWAMHVTHHSSEEFNFSVGFRSTVFEPLYRVFFYLPLALIGFNALDILYAYLVTQLYGNLVHTRYQINLPKWYGYIFVTPAQHRVHHASNIPYLDKNMGMVLIVWDRIFGTYQDENLEEETRYGLTKQPGEMGPISIIFHEWRALIDDVKHAPGLKAKLSYLFKAPGWSHNCSSLTARALQRKYDDEKKDFSIDKPSY